ncbi:Succinate--hydroxymethylglutarate CoA-transferase [Galdieria sulphuraria]|nr:Succinate--hydroxymethylglutarate CoA-transferase [Galdieria sulphuraria]
MVLSLIPKQLRSLHKTSFRIHLALFPNRNHIFIRNCSNQSQDGPLKGVRVLDLSRVLAGPFCTMQLGDLGAEVIKIERPKTGDDTRSWGPPFAPGDFSKPSGAELIKKLAAQSDVLVENFLPGKLAQYGLGYEDLQKINPRLIYCSLTGFGQTGPYAQRAGYDVIVSAIGGLMGITGPENGEPCKVGVAITDLATGMFASQVALLANIASNYLIGGKTGKRWGTAHESIVPYQGFRTKDGYLIIGALNNSQFQTLCKTLGLENLIRDDKFAKNAKRVENRQQLIEILQETFQKKTTDEWLKELDGVNLPYGPINTIDQVFRDPQVIHREMIQQIHHPSAGDIRLTGFAAKYSRTKPSIRLPPPLLGQHTQEVLKNWLTIEELNQLEKEGIIQIHSVLVPAVKHTLEQPHHVVSSLFTCLPNKLLQGKAGNWTQFTDHTIQKQQYKNHKRLFVGTLFVFGIPTLWLKFFSRSECLGLQLNGNPEEISLQTLEDSRNESFSISSEESVACDEFLPTKDDNFFERNEKEVTGFNTIHLKGRLLEAIVLTRAQVFMLHDLYIPLPCYYVYGHCW